MISFYSLYVRGRKTKEKKGKTKPGCTVAMATVARRSAFSVEYRAVIFDKREHARFYK